MIRIRFFGTRELIQKESATAQFLDTSSTTCRARIVSFAIPAAKMMDVIAKLPDCAISRRRSISLHTSQNGGRSKVAENSKVRMSRCMHTSPTTSGQNHGQTSKTQWFFLNEIWIDTHLLDCCVKDKLRKFHWDLDGKKSRIGNVYLFIDNKAYSYRYRWMTKQTAGRKQNLSPMVKKLMKRVDLGEPTSFLDHVFFGWTQRGCIFEEYEKMFESRISAGATQKLPDWE